MTGGASGIGLAAAIRFAAMGFKVCIADLGEERLAVALKQIRETGRGAEAIAVETDVSQLASVHALEREVSERLGCVNVLMNNAGVSRSSTCLDQLPHWHQMLGVNLWGVIHGAQAFVPRMLEQGVSGFIINTGSKQGHHHPARESGIQRVQGGGQSLHRGATASASKHCQCQDQRAPLDPRICVHGHDGRQSDGETRSCLDGGTDRGFHAAKTGVGGLLRSDADVATPLRRLRSAEALRHIDSLLKGAPRSHFWMNRTVM